MKRHSHVILTTRHHPRSLLSRLSAAVLCGLMATPPAAWAQQQQTQQQPYPPLQPYAQQPGQPPQQQPLNQPAGPPNQPFPPPQGALQPITPAFVPCPKPEGMGGQGDASPTGTPSGEASASVGPGGESPGGAVVLPGTTGRKTPPHLTIEESFGRVLVLEGQTGLLRQFGYSFFESPFSGLTNATDAAPGPDYLLGPDDTVSIQVWNAVDPALNRSFIVTIERDGSVYLPQIGTIWIGGHSLTQGEKLVEDRIRKFIKRFDMHMSVARIRTMKVFVVGEVIRPGAYEVSSLATASYGLYAACGPSRSGSLRRIRVVREGKPVAELDFYKFLLDGDRTQDVPLKAGDTLLVPPIGPVAAISGPVRRPGIYEVAGTTPLSSLIELAGGLQPTADRRRAQIFRVEPGRERAILDISRGIARSDPGQPVVQDGDYVRINAIWTTFENTVSLTGAVRNPGTYAYRPGLRLSELVRRDQLTPDSYLDRAEILRTDPVSYKTSLIVFSPGKVLTGRADDVELHRLDRVMIASQARDPQTVTIKGEVRRPGAYPSREGERLSSLLVRAGGFTERAFPRGAILVRPSVKAQQRAALQLFIHQQRQQIMADAVASMRGAAEASAGASVAGPENAVLQARLGALGEMENRPDLGRVVVQIDSIEKLRGTPDDLLLEDGDEITIPLRPQTVSVLGAVRHPSAFAVMSGVSGEEYVGMAGGPTEHGRVKDAYVVRPNGSTKLSISAIGPGDTIVVPERIEPKTRTLPVVASIAAIVASLATTTLTIYVITR